MKDQICIEYYELSLGTKNLRTTDTTPLPPIPRVNVKNAFIALERHATNILDKKYSFKGDRFQTSIIHLQSYDNHIEIVFAFYDGTAPDRTMEDRNTSNIQVQRRQQTEDVKHLCHAVIKFTNEPEYPHIGIEKLNGFPSSKVAWCLRKAFEDLRNSIPIAEKENLFEITNPDGTTMPDGSDDIRKFKLEPKLEPIAGTMLLEAIKEGRLKKLRLTGKKYIGIDSTSNKFKHISSDIKLSVVPTPIHTDAQAKDFFKNLLASAQPYRNIDNMKTFAVIEQEDNDNEQNILIDDANNLKTAFVKRKWFDALEGRNQFPDNTTINSVYLSEILDKF